VEVVGELHNQLVLNLVKVHLDVVAAHLLLPPVFKVEVLVLAKFTAALLLLLRLLCMLSLRHEHWYFVSVRDLQGA